MKIIDNNHRTHGATLSDIIAKSNELYICVAFLKMSGLKELQNPIRKALARGASITLFAGLDFYLTEPSALKELLSDAIDNKALKFYLCEGQGGVTFHPKIYLSIIENQAHLMIGSANLTKGGLLSNAELSLYTECEEGADVIRDVKGYLKELRKSTMCRLATPLRISEYAKKYDVYRKKVDRVGKEAKKEIKNAFHLDEEKLSRYLEEYRGDDEETNDYSYRMKKYRAARKILDHMNGREITSKAKFMAQYEKLVGGKEHKRLWHSDGLARKKNDVAKKFKTVVKMIDDIRAHDEESARELFERGMKYVKKVNGLGVNVLTEILNTYYPTKCGVLNNNSVMSLHELGFEKLGVPNTFDAERYGEFVDIMRDLKQACGFRSLAQIDHFLNFVYWEYAKPHNDRLRAKENK